MDGLGQGRPATDGRAGKGVRMLCLSRKVQDRIIIGDDITILVIAIQGDKVRLGIEAPKGVSIHRQEIYEAIQRQKAVVGHDTTGA